MSIEGKVFSLTYRPELGEIGISGFPNRRRVALYLLRDSNMNPLAYFTNEEAAKVFIEWLSALTKEEDGVK